MSDIVNHDALRAERAYIPETILSEPKNDEELIAAINGAFETTNKVLITRIKKEQIDIIKRLSAKNEFKIEFDKFLRTAILYKENLDYEEKKLGVAILSAGTSDQYIVEEIKICMKYFGWKSYPIQDVGVAGIHRTKSAIDKISGGIDDIIFGCVIVVAGLDGALFPVVAGQTELPVIAVPAPVGYGFGGNGQTALMSALQSCAPGVGVVNIGNGYGAAALASKILNQIYKINI